MFSKNFQNNSFLSLKNKSFYSSSMQHHWEEKKKESKIENNLGFPASFSKTQLLVPYKGGVVKCKLFWNWSAFVK